MANKFTRSLTELVNQLNDPRTIDSLSVNKANLVSPNNTFPLKVNPVARALTNWDLVKEEAKTIQPPKKTIANDLTVFSAVQTATEKYPVTIISSISGYDPIDVKQLSDTTYIWASKKDVVLTKISDSSLSPGGFLGSAVRAIGSDTPIKVNYAYTSFSYNGTTIQIEGESILQLLGVINNYNREQFEIRVASIAPATETLAGTTSEVLAEDLNARLTQAETDIDQAEASITVLEDTVNSQLVLKAPLASPALTGTPTAPTATQGANTTQIATTEFVTGAITDLIDGAPAVLDTLQEIAASLGDDPDFAGTLTATLALKAPLDSPGFTGTASFTGRIITNSITIDNNKISTNDTNTNLELDPNGTGSVTIQSNLLVTSNTYTDTIIPYSTDGITISGDTIFTAGIVNFQSVSQTVVPLTGATGVVTHNLSNGAVFFHSSISANFTANFTNVPTTDDRGIGVALILNQGGTGYLPTAVQIDGASVTLRWAYNTVPTPSSSQIDTVSFTLIRTGATWYVIGQHTNFA